MSKGGTDFARSLRSITCQTSSEWRLFLRTSNFASLSLSPSNSVEVSFEETGFSYLGKDGMEKLVPETAPEG